MAMRLGGSYQPPPPGSWPIIIGAYVLLIVLVLVLSMWLP